MERRPRTSSEADKLLALSDLLRSTALTIKEEWAKEDFSRAAGGDTARLLPSARLWEAQRTIEAISGSVVELVCDPSQRIQQVLSLFFESRALFIAAERRIPDLLADVGDQGMGIDRLAVITGIENRKLSRIMRTLCATHIFKEVGENQFANNRISEALVQNDGLRAYVQLFNLHVFRASEYLPKYLLGGKGASYDVCETALQDALGIEVPLWEWMAKKVPIHQVQCDGPGYPSVPDISNCGITPDDQGLVYRPELSNFALAMAGGGNASGAAHAFDFPWGDLGDGLVVDVGGGVGGFVLQLLPVYPKLRFVVQDRLENVEQGETEIFPREAPDAIRNGRVKFMAHDFFQENPVKNADVYWLRGILHDWSDEYCIRILKGLKASMGPKSKILICDPVMNTTFGCTEIPPAPYPLLANYGYHVRYCHNRDLGLMSTINGIERTPTQFKDLVDKAGLRLTKFWPVRSMVGITEVCL
ncbi:O-methyltransferase [Coccidioides immitis RS]|uniref:O-methyltransferase n=2 Tax=Coccidioides immitis TaxID=5501 RepID=J3KDZ9_COCIM|nr:O-methyltransferase [Coccidioides immitis RS]EAS33659.3 O-methyltransferase [Coccidioides immitis RS]KMP04845.1 hypothetical protein CIRG_04526 [Coccidioides immitis RMSCC 2394]TPX21322.1 hypothetical protein DIZ76_015278 [Coccidioides immitis]